ncbi:MAG: prolyl-tRNA synthetase associated domain-containing protein, partial [Oscillospiraceae bacterium]|nr:prolyl-tRNA synthetase associated domain-containing protein [Oscillospiraceae bacterium]
MTVSPLQPGAPAECSARARASFDLLDSLGISYQCLTHDAADTMELCAAISDALQVRICKNLFLCNRQQTAFYLLS